MSVLSLWQRISAIGAHADDTPAERRRVILTNQGLLIGFVSDVAYAVGFGVAGPRFLVLAVANASVAVLQLFCFGLMRRGQRTAAKVTALVALHAMAGYTALTLGLGIGMHYYFFLFAMLAFLLFGEQQGRLRVGFAVLSAASCLFVGFTAAVADVMDLPEEVIYTLNVTTSMSVMGSLIFFVRLFTHETAQAEGKLAVEHARSERLLLNVLPKSISARLKDDEQAIADGFAEVTVLFADLVGFTELSSRLDAASLVKMLNHVFSAFDDLAADLGLEKIKTIGDCYMVAAGLPDRRDDHVVAAARMALGMRVALDKINKEGGYALRLRIGLHTGPVVAGVIGKRKFIYDLWGDTVNTASRMESSGIEQEIQVTKQVYDQLVGKFDLAHRGTIKVKGKGELETYLLRGELPVNGTVKPVVAALEGA